MSKSQTVPGNCGGSAWIAHLNEMSGRKFSGALGHLFEGATWVAARAGSRRPFRDVRELKAALWDVVLAADAELQDSLLLAHPPLAAEADRSHELSARSAEEQRSTGLDGSSALEQDELRRLNRAHQERFGFPFVVAVHGMSMQEILATLQLRLSLDGRQARAEALDQVRRIAERRLDRLLSSPVP